MKAPMWFIIGFVTAFLILAGIAMVEAEGVEGPACDRKLNRQGIHGLNGSPAFNKVPFFWKTNAQFYARVSTAAIADELLEIVEKEGFFGCSNYHVFEGPIGEIHNPEYAYAWVWTVSCYWCDGYIYD